MNKKPELLAPVGNWPMLQAAIKAGADAVYLGVKGSNMRASARNFELNELNKVSEEAHKHNVRVYLTVNTIVFEDELSKIKKLLKEAKKSNIDAIICWDHAVILEAHKLGFEVHLSTQASVSNSAAANFYEKTGVSRVILARECSLKQIKELKKHTKLKIECFIHGAMCVAVSGRCFTSQFLYGKSANRGECLQPCRRKYKVIDLETNDELVLGNNYIMSPKDLCTLPILDKLVAAGINVFKIEGRNRSPEYVKAVVCAYRQAIDAIVEARFNKELIDNLMQKLEEVYHRKFHTGFYLGTPTADDFTDVYGSASTKQKVYVGYVKKYYQKIGVAELFIETKSLKIGDRILITGKTTGVHEQRLDSMELDHEKIEKAVKGQRVAIKVKQFIRPRDKVFILIDSQFL